MSNLAQRLDALEAVGSAEPFRLVLVTRRAGLGGEMASATVGNECLHRGDDESGEQFLERAATWARRNGRPGVPLVWLDSLDLAL